MSGSSSSTTASSSTSSSAESTTTTTTSSSTSLTLAGSSIYFKERQVVVHPIVLLSVVDHYNRTALGTSKRVVGTLLGEVNQGNIHITNSFAVPFEEDTKDSTVWFFDNDYHQHMVYMFKKVNANERVVGWYSSGPEIKAADLELHELYRKHHTHPVYLIVNTQPKDLVAPTSAYYSVDETTSDKTFRKTFKHIPSTIGAYEAEEVGVEHLLRDLRTCTTSTLPSRVGDALTAIENLITKLRMFFDYITDVYTGKIVSNPQILYNLQDILSLLPDIEKEELVRGFAVETNDTMLAIYLGNVIRTIMAVHKLLNNKLDNGKQVADKTALASNDSTTVNGTSTTTSLSSSSNSCNNNSKDKDTDTKSEKK